MVPLQDNGPNDPGPPIPDAFDLAIISNQPPYMDGNQQNPFRFAKVGFDLQGAAATYYNDLINSTMFDPHPNPVGSGCGCP